MGLGKGVRQLYCKCLQCLGSKTSYPNRGKGGHKTKKKVQSEYKRHANYSLTISSFDCKPHSGNDELEICVVGFPAFISRQRH